VRTRLPYLILAFVSITACCNRKPNEAEIDTSLHKACRSGYIQQVQLLIANGSDINGKVNNGNTPLHYAAEYGHLDVVELLIAKGADIDAKNHSGATPLFYAACKGHSNLVELFADKGADVNAKGLQPWTSPLITELKNRARGSALHMAIEFGHKKVAKVLLAHGANANIEDGWNINKPLHIAALKGYSDIVQELIKKDAIINVKSQAGETPLHFAVSSGSLDIVKLLIAEGAHVNPKNINGRTPLHLALRVRNMEMVALLDRYGAK